MDGIELLWKRAEDDEKWVFANRVISLSPFVTFFFLIFQIIAKLTLSIKCVVHLNLIFMVSHLREMKVLVQFRCPVILVILICHLIVEIFDYLFVDFGLAKLSNDITTHVSAPVMGTFGHDELYIFMYMAPEYASSGKLTDRSDVFLFGVLLLDLVTGRRTVEASHDESLVEWARPLITSAIKTGDFSELADPRLEKRYVEREKDV
ncbi:hypothetical protein MKW92_009250 [Papaver armeniacum]|nr:hypothetical protein MKW92_009250 [Papaver armeniacum]